MKHSSDLSRASSPLSKAFAVRPGTGGCELFGARGGVRGSAQEFARDTGCRGRDLIDEARLIN
jgi:hypothetical protein